MNEHEIELSFVLKVKETPRLIVLKDDVHEDSTRLWETIQAT